MHTSDLSWWRWAKSRYPWVFEDRGLKVLEVGSMNINGSIRHLFEPRADGGKYIGIDWRPGKDVDLTVPVEKLTAPPRSYDVVVSASMLEHAHTPLEALTSMIRVLQCRGGDHPTSGTLLMTFGGLGSSWHSLKSAIDGQYHPVETIDVLAHLSALKMKVVHFSRQEDMFPGEAQPNDFYSLVAVKGLRPGFDFIPAIQR